MKRKGLAIAGLVAGLSVLTSMTAFAGEWKQDATGWWYQNDDGSYPVSTWQWLDGNKDGLSESYYFNESGYLVTNTTIDGYTVNADGAWTENGEVQYSALHTTPSNNQKGNGNSITNIQNYYIDSDGNIISAEEWYAIENSLMLHGLTDLSSGAERIPLAPTDKSPIGTKRDGYTLHWDGYSEEAPYWYKDAVQGDISQAERQNWNVY